MVARRSMVGLFEDRRKRRPDLPCGRRRLEPPAQIGESRTPSTGLRCSRRTVEGPLLRGTHTWPSWTSTDRMIGSEHQPVHQHRLGAMEPGRQQCVVASAASPAATDLWFLSLDGRPERQLRVLNGPRSAWLVTRRAPLDLPDVGRWTVLHARCVRCRRVERASDCPASAATSIRPGRRTVIGSRSSTISVPSGA